MCSVDSNKAEAKTSDGSSEAIPTSKQHLPLFHNHRFYCDGCPCVDEKHPPREWTSEEKCYSGGGCRAVWDEEHDIKLKGQSTTEWPAKINEAINGGAIKASVSADTRVL